MTRSLQSSLVAVYYQSHIMTIFSVVIKSYDDMT